MKDSRRLRLAVTSAVFLVALARVGAQGTFQNLGFESASLVPIPGDPYNRVQFTNAFPGWTAYVGGIQQDAALYNNAFLDSSGVSIIDHGWPGLLGGSVIQGTFTAILQAGVQLGTFQPADAKLIQNGLIPGTAQSLRFGAFPSPASSPFEVTIAGQSLPLTILATRTNYTLFGADITAWAGQTANLEFTVLASRPPRSSYFLFLDSIQFSELPVPEPNPVPLLAVGGLLISLWLRHQSRHKGLN